MKKIAFTLFLSLLTLALLAQQAELNKEGEKIIRFEDGSWRYMDEKDPEDIALWQKYMARQEALKEQERKKALAETGERERLNAAREWLKEAGSAEQAATIARLLVEEKLQAEENQADSLQAALTREYQQRKQAEKTAIEIREKAEDALALAEKLVEKPEKTKWIEQFNDLFPTERLLHSPTAAVEEPQSVFFHNAPQKLKKYDRSKDVYYHPPPVDCRFLDKPSENTKTGKLEPALLFSYTNDKLRPFLKEKDFITCQASLSREDKNIYVLSLEILISSHLAREEFGYIDKDSPLVLYLIDGNRVILYNHKTDTGDLNEEEKTVTYRPQYVLEKFDKKVLEELEITKARIVWSAGYEDYPIYEMDFFLDRFKCLE
jgi:hypothetical protein